eukprot:CAMPEP_0114655214 /NCGR_PEP_ID=MMETSP0191-20121206/10965_1 /TAXON_ID=126664 /ORGANISM="Sorites sp." /LENGTH=271 /DNA_ID=CAMNT_0001870895 /DNA_START=827 /DNA_END=1643 /DNA_ORIENTATION=+
MPDPHIYCRQQIVYAWAVGGSIFYYPENVGYEYFEYAMLEMHYDNPNEVAGVIDNSGLRMYYTDELRDETAEMLVAATETYFRTLFIPPGVEHALITGYCDLDLISDRIPETGVTAFASMLHAHTAAVSLRLRHVRDGVELKPIDNNPTYDFDYQQTIALDNVLILPGDKLLIECVFNTSNRDFMTYGGISSREEMCQGWLTIYPAVGSGFCASTQKQETFESFLNTASERGYWDGEMYDASTEDALNLYHEYTCANKNIMDLLFQINTPN